LLTVKTTPISFQVSISNAFFKIGEIVTMEEPFVKTYHPTATNTPYKFSTIVRHNGTVIAFAVDSDRMIYYSVLDLGDQRERGPLDVNYWQENPQRLIFPNEIVTVGQGLIDPIAMPQVKKGTRDEVTDGTRLRENEKNIFLSTTARFTADAPVQILSDGKYVYVYRQSIAGDHADGVFLKNAKGEFVTDQNGEKIPLTNNNLLVDRFVLSGTTLLPKLEVRFQRSRNKFKPLNRKDGLGAKDLEKKPFYEPTQKLDFIRNLISGRFSVLLLPTQIAGVQRWQVFAHNSKTELMDSFNIERSDDGLFNTQGRKIYTCPDHTNLRLLKGGDCPEPALADATQNCPFQLIPLASTSGFAESALKFDGQDDAVSITVPEITSGEMTIEVWLKRDDSAGPQTIISLGAEQEHNLSIDENGTLIFQYGEKTAEGGPSKVFSSNATLTPDQWTHIALVKSRGEGRLRWYIDGSVKNEAVLTDDGPLPTGDALRIGDGAAGKFAGIIDEVRLWTRPRFEVEIRETMHQRLIGYEIGLAGYWHFDEASGDDAFDQTENAHHGKIDGNAEWLTSDAPVGDHPGIRHTSFRFADKTIQSGPTSLLYYQQENATSGYDGQNKPLKKAGKVMLAVATQSDSLTLTPDEINQRERRIQELSGRISGLEENIKMLENEKVALAKALAEGRATVFRHIYYVGDFQTLIIGDYTRSALSSLDKNISSIKISPVLKATFYSGPDFTGDEFPATVDLTDFRLFPIENSPTGTWNDYPSSLKIAETEEHRQAREQVDQYLQSDKAQLEELKLLRGQLSNEIKDAQRYIAILDFALSRDGKLPQIPDNVNLPFIESPLPDENTVYELLDQINKLTQSQSTLQTELQALKDAEIDLRNQPFVDAAMRYTDPESDETHPLFFKDQRVLDPTAEIDPDGDIDDPIEHLGVVQYFRDHVAVTGVDAAISFKIGEQQPAYFFKNEQVLISGLPPAPPSNLNIDGAAAPATTDAEDENGDEEEPPEFGSLEWAKEWVNRNTTEPSAALKLGNRYFIFVQNAYRVYHGDSETFDEWVQISDGVFPELWADGVDAAIEMADDSVCFIKGLTCKTYKSAGDFIQLQSEDAIENVFPELLPRFGFPELEQNRRRQLEIENELAAIPQQIVDLNNQLEEARAAELKQIDVRVPMSLVHTDPEELTVLGALLGFAWTKDSPLLFDSANGRLGLYFRGLEDQFFVSYYDTMINILTFKLPTNGSGEVLLMPRQNGSWEGALIEVADGETDDTCTLTLQNEEMEIQEIWRDVPRSASAFAAVLNGLGEAAQLGTLAEEISGTVEYLEISDGAPEDFSPGMRLVVGETPVEVVGAVKQVALKFGNASDFVALPEVITSNAGTIEMWIKFPTTLVNQAIFDASTNDDPAKQFLLEISDQRLRLSLSDKKNNLYRHASIAFEHIEADDQWHHLVAVWQYGKENVARIYIDGKQVARDARQAGTRPAFQNPFVGKSRGSLVRSNFQGEIAEITIWHEARSKQLIIDDSDRSLFDPSAKNLAGSWRFLQLQSGLIAKDQSASQQDAIINGAPGTTPFGNDTTILQIEPITLDQPIAAGASVSLTYDYDNNPETNVVNTERRSKMVNAHAGTASGWVQNAAITGRGIHSPNNSWVADAPGTALAFDGEDDFVALADSARLDSLDHEGDISLEAWVLPDAVPALSRVLHHKSDDRTYTLALEKAPIRSALNFNGNSFIDCGTNLNPGDQPWTVELWFRANLTGGQRILFNKEDLYEAAINDGFVQFAMQPDWIWFGGESFPVTPGTWYHVAVVYDGHKQYLYRNGLLIFSRDKTNAGHIGSNGKKLLLGARGDNAPHNFFTGAMDDVRIWNLARSGAELRSNMTLRLKGDESSLRSYWHFDGGIARDYSPNGNDGILSGQLAIADSPIPAYAIVAGAGAKIDNVFTETFVKTRDAIPCNQWNHVAAVYNESYALKFDGRSASVNCGNNASLNIGGDLTIEAFLRVDDLSQPRSIVTRGQRDVPYAFYISPRGNLVFYFEDADGNRHTFFSSDAQRLTAGQFYRVAVTRKQESETKEKTVTQVINGESFEVKIPEVEKWTDVNFHVGRLVGADYQIVQTGKQRYDGPEAEGNSEELLIGGALSGHNFPFQGVISEVRVWSLPRNHREIGQPIQGAESGLVSWWRFEENEGYAAEDAVGTNHGVINNAKWLKNPDPLGATFTLYRNGSLMERVMVAAANYPKGDNQFTVGARKNGGALEAFRGVLEEIRVWRVARTQEQIQDNLFRRLLGEKEDLIAYYTFDKVRDNIIRDHGLRGNHLNVDANQTFVFSTAPVSNDTYQVRSALAGIKTPFNDVLHSQPGVQEYGDMQFDAEGNLIGVLKRCYAFIKNGEWNLVTGYKVGDLITEWVGQVQFNPELKGFIEGAPPVPSENLTAGPVDPAFADYANACDLEVVEAENITYTYAASKEAGLNAGFKLSAQAGVDTTVLMITAPLGIGTAQEVADVNVLVGLEGSFDAAAGWSSENVVGAGRNVTKSTKVSLGGNWEDPANQLNQAMRRRYQPANVGFALVQSETADVFALRLSHNLALVSYQFRPNPDIPKDWNIIPFPMNPRYTKQGTLDGAVGYDERGKVLDPDYPNAREYGQHSYFKPKEAYALKNQIQREEQELRNYFESLGTSLGGASDLAVSAGLGLIKGGASGGAAGAIEGLVSALANHTGVPEKLGKQNIVNTYVWTADGGFFAESTEVTSMKQETTGGSFSFSGSVGLSVGVDFSVVGVDVSLGFSAMLGGNLNLTKTKSKEAQNSFSVNVAIGIPGDLQAYDENLTRLYDPLGNPIIVPGKVDAYRFMTFYLEPRVEHFDEFFNNVVDPIWLQGSHPNALALKQAQQADKKPPCFRVMHRVTFVSRILPEIPADNAPPLEQNLKVANIDSNWELIQKLDPFVRNKTATFTEFSDAIRNAVNTHVPELKSNVEEIITYLSGYYQVFEET
jgi:hypothetical protein